MIPRRRGKTEITDWQTKAKNSSSIEIFYDRSSDVTVVTSKRRRTVTISCPWTRVVCTESRGGKTEEPREREKERERLRGRARFVSRANTSRARLACVVSSSGSAVRMETRHTCRCLVLVDDRPPPPPPADHPGVWTTLCHWLSAWCGLCWLTNCTGEQFLRQRLPGRRFELRLLARGSENSWGHGRGGEGRPEGQNTTAGKRRRRRRRRGRIFPRRASWHVPLVREPRPHSYTSRAAELHIRRRVFFFSLFRVCLYARLYTVCNWKLCIRVTTRLIFASRWRRELEKDHVCFFFFLSGMCTKIEDFGSGSTDSSTWRDCKNR